MNTITHTANSGSLRRLVRRWMVRVEWRQTDGYFFVRADWYSPSGTQDEGDWFTFDCSLAPSQSSENPGDRAPRTVQGTIWKLCDEAWQQWQAANRDLNHNRNDHQMSTAINPQVNQTLKLNHARFGTATVKIISIQGEWIDVEIVKGRLVGMNDEWHPGDKKTVRSSHCTFTA